MTQSRGITLAVLSLATLVGVVGLSACGGDFAGDGKVAFKLGKYRDAVEFLQIALAEKEDSEGRFFLGVALNRIGRPNQARSALAPLLDHPDYRRRAVRAIVDILIALNRAGEATKLAAKALRNEPRDPTLLEAAVLANSARLQKARLVIDTLIENQLGEGMARRAAAHVDQMVAAHAPEFETVFAREMKRITARWPFEDEDTLRRLVVNSRAALADLSVVLEQSRAVDPTSFTSRLELARIAWQRRDSRNALLVAGEIIQIDPDSISEPERRNVLSSAKRGAATLIRTVAERSKAYAEGIKLLEDGLDQFPRSALNPDLARLYYLADDREKLTKLSKEWVEHDVRNVWACFYRGWALFRDGSADQSIPYLLRAQGASPSTAAFNLVLGRAYFQRGDVGLAMAFLAKAQEQAPRDPQVVLDVANAYVASGDSDQARLVLASALRTHFRNRNSPEARLVQAELVNLYQQVGQNIQGLGRARRLHQDEPDNPYIALRLAQLEQAHGANEQATTLVRAVQKKFPNLSDAWRIGAELSTKQRSWGTVGRQLDMLEKLEPGDPTIPWLRATALIKQRRYDDARKAAQVALIRNPGERGVLIALVDIELAQQRWAQAAERARSALKLHPEDLDLESRLAKAQAGRNDWKSAVATLERIEPRNPDDVDLLRTLGQGLAALGNREKGGAKLLKAFALTPPRERQQRFLITKAMYVARADTACETATREYLENLPREDKRWPLAMMQLTRVQHRQRKYLEACDTLVELRRLGFKQESTNLFIDLATQSGAFHEATSAFDAAKTKGVLEERALRGALKAQIAVGDWKNALEIIRRLGLIKPEFKTAFELEKAQAQLGLGRKTPALASFRRAISAREGRARGNAYAVAFRQLAAIDEPREIIRILDVALGEASNNGAVQLLGGAALLTVGEVDKAIPLLSAAVRRAKGADLTRARLLLCAAQVARQSYGMANDALKGENGRDALAVKSLLAALVSNKRPSSEATLADYFWELRQKKFNEARSTAQNLTDMPRAWRIPLGDLALHLARHEARSSRVVEILARAVIMARVGVLGDGVERSLKDARNDHPADALWLDAFRAWARLEFDAPRDAAAIVVPRIAAGSKDLLMLELAAIATLGNTDAKNVVRVINGQIGSGSIAPALAHDLARVLVDHGDLAVAYGLLTRIKDPKPEDIALRIRIAIDLNDFSSAGTLAVGLPAAVLKGDPMLAFAAAYGRLKRGHSAAKKQLLAVLADPNTTGQIPFSVLAEVLASVGRRSDITKIVEQRLEVEPYDAYVLHQAYRAFKRAGADEEAKRMAAAAAIVDPRARLRMTPRAERSARLK